ncbi:MAG: methyltransferase domain-containing protein [Defluviitaleaceae bacterium]|nr:methyltransferase domain-containing protein [Defluviitaleaceae bacterium]
MVDARESENEYTQLVGKIELLHDFKDATFDVIICHNVLEFAEERVELVAEFARLLKNDGILSIVKNNKHGRIISKVVFENDVKTAIDLLDGGSISNTFGKVVLYDPSDLTSWASSLSIKKVLALRALFGSKQNNSNSEWSNEMFNLEMKICDLEPYKSFSLFNHVILKKSYE